MCVPDFEDIAETFATTAVKLAVRDRHSSLSMSSTLAGSDCFLKHLPAVLTFHPPIHVGTSIAGSVVKVMEPMQTKRKYTNATFTKRVDHEAGRHRPGRAIKEPTTCRECGAHYANRRWTSSDDVVKGTQKDSAHMTLCPACKQENRADPRGFVFIDGAFFTIHQLEIEQLLRNEAARAAEDNVLARILDWKKDEGHKLSITTTTEHLAQRLGHALQKAFDGEVKYDFSHENKLARVNWRRE